MGMPLAPRLVASQRWPDACVGTRMKEMRRQWYVQRRCGWWRLQPCAPLDVPMGAADPPVRLRLPSRRRRRRQRASCRARPTTSRRMSAEAASVSRGPKLARRATTSCS